jgi:hypothetical protein
MLSQDHETARKQSAGTMGRPGLRARKDGHSAESTNREGGYEGPSLGCPRISWALHGPYWAVGGSRRGQAEVRQGDGGARVGLAHRAAPKATSAFLRA